MILNYNQTYKKLDIIVLFLNLTFVFLSLYNVFFAKFLLLTSSLANIILIYKSRKDKSFIIMFFFWFTYILYVFPYFYFDIHLTPFETYQNDYIFTLTLIIHSFFLTIFNLFFKEIKNKKNPLNYIRVKDNAIFFIGSVIVMIFIVIFGKAGETIFESGGYGRGTTISFLNLAIYEYYYIFFLLAVKYSKLKRTRLIIIFLISFFYILKNLLLGGRIESLQLLLLIFLLFFSYRISNKLFLLSAILGIYFFDLWGRIRGNPFIIFEGFEFLNPFNLNVTVITNNQTNVFYNSAAFIGLIEDGLFDITFRLKSFLFFILSLFVPSKYIPQEYTLWQAGRSLGVNYGGGGLVSVIIFTWTGILGVLIVAYFFAKIFNQYNKDKKSEYISIYIFMLLSTFPRWFAYSPITAFKLSVISVIVFWIVDKLEEIFSRKQY